MRTEGPFPFRAILSGVAIFLCLSVPSLKLIYSTSLLNIVATGAVVLAALFRISEYLPPGKRYLLFLWTVFVCGLLIATILNQQLSTLEEVAKAANFVITVYAIIVCGDSRSGRLATLLLLFWGTLLALWQLILGVPTSRELGQHYLTVSLPIGAASAAYLVIALFGGTRSSLRTVAAMGAIVCFAATSTLLSRSAMLFPLLIVSGFGLVKIIGTTATRQVRSIAIAVMVVSVVAYAFGESIDLGFEQFRQGDRLIQLLEEPGREPRVEIYASALSFLEEHWVVGAGVGSFESVHGVYPHNLFLDVAISGGMIALVAFCVAVYLFVAGVISALRAHSQGSLLVALYAMASYFLFQWNTSFDLGSAFIPIGAMMLALNWTREAMLERMTRRVRRLLRGVDLRRSDGSSVGRS